MVRAANHGCNLLQGGRTSSVAYVTGTLPTMVHYPGTDPKPLVKGLLFPDPRFCTSYYSSTTPFPRFRKVSLPYRVGSQTRLRPPSGSTTPERFGLSSWSTPTLHPARSRDLGHPVRSRINRKVLGRCQRSVLSLC